MAELYWEKISEKPYAGVDGKGTKNEFVLHKEMHVCNMKKRKKGNTIVLAMDIFPDVTKQFRSY